MMKDTPLVRRQMAPITSAASAEPTMARPHCTKPFSRPWKAGMPTA